LLFNSLLDERQRRLFAGLKSIKLGHGGDSNRAEFLGLDPHTAARGRQQLLDQNVSMGRTRRSGGGRKPVKKKPPTSSLIELLLECDYRRRSNHWLKWSRRTTVKVVMALDGFGVSVSLNTVARLTRWAIPCASIARNSPLISVPTALISSSTWAILGTASNTAAYPS
jgi:hypothetical protein